MYRKRYGLDDIDALAYETFSPGETETESPMHAAVRNDDVIKLRWILAGSGLDPDATNFYGWTALHVACQEGRAECAAALLIGCGLGGFWAGRDAKGPAADEAADGPRRVSEPPSYARPPPCWEGTARRRASSLATTRGLRLRRSLRRARSSPRRRSHRRRRS